MTVPSTRGPLPGMDPRHGTAAPTTATPARRPGSVRRTTTVDARRPDGFRGVRLVGAGRDLRSGADGGVEVLATARTDITVRAAGGQIVESVVTDPPLAGIEALVGKPAGGGFRRVLDAEVDVAPGALVYLLLDEVPVSTLVSGYAVVHAVGQGALARESSPPRPAGPPRQVPDLCAGWQRGGILQTALAEQGYSPVLVGPEAPALVDPEDPLGWHEWGPLGPHEMRRARRHDLWRGDDGLLHAETLFRDSHMDTAGAETIVHEYTIEATFSADAATVVGCRATPRVLPWRECPQAVPSAERVAGMPVAELRSRVRAELKGRTTCTHLNDTLRELGDVVALAAMLP